jgi:hypothetical protein
VKAQEVNLASREGLIATLNTAVSRNCHVPATFIWLADAREDCRSNVVTEKEYARKLDELDRLLNDPEVPMEPAKVWSLLAEISQRDLSASRAKPDWSPRTAPSRAGSIPV